MSNPPGAAERSWVCPPCSEREQLVARALSKLTAPRPEVERVREGKGLRILVIDDQALMRRSLVRLLAEHETYTAASPSEAVSLLQSGVELDAIVCDVMMPEMSGPELYARCFERFPELARRFVFASADPLNARLMIADAARRVGAEHLPVLLKKPTSRVALLAAVSSVARNAGHRSGTYELHFPAEASQPEERPLRDSKAG